MIPGLGGSWQLFALVLVVFGFAPGAVLRAVVRAYPKNHPRRRELVAELYGLRYVERPLYVAQQIETAIFEGIPTRWRSRRSPVSLGERLGAWRRQLAPVHDVASYLTDGEQVIHVDHPSYRAFLIKNLVDVAGLASIPGLLVMSVSWGLVWLACLIVPFCVAMLATLAIRRLRDRSTTCVVTNLRLIHLPGTGDRSPISMLWSDVTSLGYRQKPLGRLLGYATIAVEASAESTLYEVSDLNDPAAFHQHIVDVVSSGWGGDPKQRRTLLGHGRLLILRLLRSPGPNGAWRRHYLPLPDEILHEYLGKDERLILLDHASCRSRLTKTATDLGVATVANSLAVLTLFGIESLWTFVIWSCLEFLLLLQALRRLADTYVAYATTNRRLIRVSGVVGRKVMSVPWDHVTSVDYIPRSPNQPDRPDVICIEAEGSFWPRELTDIAEPNAFYQHLLAMTAGVADVHPDNKPAQPPRPDPNPAAEVGPPLWAPSHPVDSCNDICNGVQRKQGQTGVSMVKCGQPEMGSDQGVER